MVVAQKTVKDMLRENNSRNVLRKYEVVLIINPDYAMTQVLDLFKRLESYVQEAQGSFGDPEYWGFRTLAYPINKRNKAHYVYCVADLNPASVKELERFVSVEMHMGVFRHLILKSDNEGLNGGHTMLRQASLEDAVNGVSQTPAAAA